MAEHLLLPVQSRPKMLNPTEDAHIKSISPFETDEHLRNYSFRLVSLCSAIILGGYCAVQHKGIYKRHTAPRGPLYGKVIAEMSEVQKYSEEFQRVGKDGFDAAVSSFGEVNKGLQAIAAEFTAYSKKTFEDGTRAFEQLLRAKSFEQVIEVQSQYARMAYEAHVAELSKLGEMYAGLTRNAYKPVEQAAAKAGSPNRLRSA